MTNPGEEEWITARQAALLVGVHERTIRYWVSRGYVRSEKLRGFWLRVNRADVLKWATEPGTPPAAPREEGP